MPPVTSDMTVEFVKTGEREPEAKKRLVLGVYFRLMVFSPVAATVTRYF